MADSEVGGLVEAPSLVGLLASRGLTGLQSDLDLRTRTQTLSVSNIFVPSSAPRRGGGKED